MNTLKAYLGAVKPKIYVILGIVLRRFCIGHFLLLADNESLMINDEERKLSFSELTTERWWSELVSAISICRHDPEEYEAIQKDKTLLDDERSTVDRIIKEYIQEQRKENIWKTRLRKTVNYLLCLKRFNRAWLPKDVFEPLEAFNDFRAYSDYKIPMWQFNTADKSTTKKSPSKHWTIQITEELAQKSNRTITEIRKMPIPECWQAWAIAAENEGLITLLDEQNVERIDAWDKAGINNLEIEGASWDELVAAHNKRGGLYA